LNGPGQLANRWENPAASELLPYKKLRTHREALWDGHLFVFSPSGGDIVQMHILNDFCLFKTYKEVLPNKISKNNRL
jgi:hypothetical protein